MTEYIRAAMKEAHYELLPDEEGYFGKIEGLPGGWANADTLEACRDDLQEVLEEWIVAGLKNGHPIPAIGSIYLRRGKTFGSGIVGV